MCVFCNLSSPISGKMPGIELVNYYETAAWVLGFSIWLIILYQGFHNCKLGALGYEIKLYPLTEKSSKIKKLSNSI